MNDFCQCKQTLSNEILSKISYLNKILILVLKTVFQWLVASRSAYTFRRLELCNTNIFTAGNTKLKLTRHKEMIEGGIFYQLRVE